MRKTKVIARFLEKNGPLYVTAVYPPEGHEHGKLDADYTPYYLGHTRPAAVEKRMLSTLWLEFCVERRVEKPSVEAWAQWLEDEHDYVQFPVPVIVGVVALPNICQPTETLP